MRCKISKNNKMIFDFNLISVICLFEFSDLTVPNTIKIGYNILRYFKN